jgi:hypothetical protein
MKGDKAGKYALGAVMILLGTLTATGFDKTLEAGLLSALPE